MHRPTVMPGHEVAEMVRRTDEGVTEFPEEDRVRMAWVVAPISPPTWRRTGDMGAVMTAAPKRGHWPRTDIPALNYAMASVLRAADPVGDRPHAP